MIYEGKEYVEVTDNSGAIGDLIHVTEVERVGCDIWGFTTDSDFMTPDINVVLPNGWETLDGYNDEWTRYRYVKDVEENSSFSVGDKVKIVGTSIEGYGEHIGNNADVVRIFSGGDVRVSNKIGENNYMDNMYPPSSLELIEKQRQSITEELSQTVESNAIALDKATRNKINEVAKRGE